MSSKVNKQYLDDAVAVSADIDQSFAKQERLNELATQLMDLIRITSLSELSRCNTDGKPLSNTAARLVAAGYRQIARDLEMGADEDDRRGRNW